MKEPYVTTYTKKYRVIRNRRLKKERLFLCRETAHYLISACSLSTSQLIACQEPVATQCVSTLYKLCDKAYLLNGRNRIMITNEYILTKAFYFYSKVLFLFMILFYIHSKGGLIINGRDLWICSGFQHRPERRTTDY